MCEFYRNAWTKNVFSNGTGQNLGNGRSPLKCF